jgi:hypothetical protein
MRGNWAVARLFFSTKKAARARAAFGFLIARKELILLLATP